MTGVIPDLAVDATSTQAAASALPDENAEVGTEQNAVLEAQNLTDTEVPEVLEA